jgi:sterol desaturase/sphingolipid hydroxylase (fatty acid hydroxylase superfamily)
MLPWIDKLFGTFHLPKQWPDKYGIDTPIAHNLSGQLLDPLLPTNQ